MLTYYLDAPEDENVNKQEPEVVRLKIREPVVATVTETFEQIVLSPETRDSREAITSDGDVISELTYQTSHQNSRPASIGETDSKPWTIDTSGERGATAQAIEDNRLLRAGNERSLIEFENEPRVRNVSNRDPADGGNPLNCENEGPVKNRWIPVETDVDEILDDDADCYRTKETSIDEQETEIFTQTNNEEFSNARQNNANPKDDFNASDEGEEEEEEEGHPSSSLSSAPSFDTVIFKMATAEKQPASYADNVGDATKENDRRPDDPPIPAISYPQTTAAAADDTDEDEVLELELDNTLKTAEEPQWTNKDSAERGGGGDDDDDDGDALLGAVGGQPASGAMHAESAVRDARTELNNGDRSHHHHRQDQCMQEHSYEDVDKMHLHNALSRLGTAFFLLLAAIIFHLLNRIVGDELE